jgi:hypothetical protein
MKKLKIKSEKDLDKMEKMPIGEPFRVEGLEFDVIAEAPELEHKNNKKAASAKVFS